MRELQSSNTLIKPRDNPNTFAWLCLVTKFQPKIIYSFKGAPQEEKKVEEPVGETKRLPPAVREFVDPVDACKTAFPPLNYRSVK